MKPCRRCGGEKSPGWPGWYCKACGPVMQEEALERARERAQRNRVSVPNDALREAFLRSGMTKAEAAHSLGWYAGTRPTGTLKVDTTRVTRTIGMNGQRTVHRSTAVKMAAALGLDPVDLDV